MAKNTNIIIFNDKSLVTMDNDDHSGGRIFHILNNDELDPVLHIGIQNSNEYLNDIFFL